MLAFSNRLLLVLACLLAGSGCLARHLPQPIEVTVRDADTGAPVSGATVGLKTRPSLEVDPITAVADDKGKAIVKVRRSATVAYETPVWEVSAPGYLACEERGRADFMRTTSRLFELKRGPARLVVTLPNGYRGPVLIDKRSHEKWLQVQQGQREFKHRAELNGYVAVDASPLMVKWLAEAEVRLVDEQGEPVPESSIRKIASTPQREILVVGTDEDVSSIRQVVFNEAPRDKKPGCIPPIVEPAKVDELFRKAREECGLD